MLTVVKNEYIESSRNEEERSLENHKAHLQDFKSDIDLLLMNLLESINKHTESLVQAKDVAIKELEEGLNAKVRAVESHLREKEELLKSRDGQLEALRSEVTVLTERMAEIESVNKQAEGLLQEEVRRKEEVLQAKDVAIKELEEGLNAKVHAVESHLSEKEELLKSRDGQLEALRSEVTVLTERMAGMESVNKQAEGLLQEEVRRKEEVLQAKDVAIRELEEGLNAKVHAVESHLSEKEELLKSRDGQLEALRSEVTVLTERMAGMESVNKQAEGLLQEEVRRKEEVLQAKDVAIKELEEGLNAKVHAVESHLREKEELLKSRDGQLEALRSEVTALTERMAGMESVNKQAEDLLQEEVRRKEEVLQAKDVAIKELEEGLNAKVHAVESHLSEKEELLKSRDGQLQALRSEVTALTERMAEIESVNKQAEGLLQEEVKRKEEVLQANHLYQLVDQVLSKIPS